MQFVLPDTPPERRKFYEVDVFLGICIILLDISIIRIYSA